MALPVILVNSASGSDSLASGAGPATALTGSAASTNGAGTVVTLDGSPDLSGVAADGSAVIYLADATAGARNFGKITTVDNTAKTVTVADAFGISLSGLSWAIGGKRASIGSTSSRKLFENNAAAGDLMPGWTVRMESGHAESLTTAITFRRAGDQTDGAITLEGDPAAATRPVLTWTANVNGISNASAARIKLAGFDLLNSNATKTASVAITTNTRWRLDRLRIGNPANGWRRAIETVGFCVVTGTKIDTTAETPCVSLSGDTNAVLGCVIQNSTGVAILISGGRGTVVAFNIIKDASTIGIDMSNDVGGPWIIGNSVYSCGTDAIRCASTADESFVMVNNLLVSNGGYGFNYSAGTLGRFNGGGNHVANNAFFNNTSGETNPSTIPDEDGVTLTGDPFTNAAADDFSLNDTAGAGAACKAAGFPGAGSVAIGFSSTTSFTDIGAAQAECTAGAGGSLLRPVAMSGGLV